MTYDKNPPVIAAATMQQLMFIKPQTLEWQEVPTPKIQGPGEALVRPLAVTRCDLDLYIATGTYPLQGGFGFGHEVAGEVVAVGDDVSSVAPGDKVIVPFQINCGRCEYCLRGQTNACVAVPQFSAYGLAPSSGKDWGGGLADLVHVPFADSMLVVIPPGLSLSAAASLADNAVDGFRTINTRLQEHPGAPVLVLGGLAQSVGLYAAQAALALKSERVLYCDNDSARLAIAHSLGAETIHFDALNESNTTDQFPVVVDAACYPAALALAMRQVSPCGSCISVSSAMQGQPVDLPLRQMYMKGVSWEISRAHARGALDKALGCLSCGFDPDQVITRRLGFADADEAMCDPGVKLVFEFAPPVNTHQTLD